MQKLRITNTYNKENNQYEKGTFDIKESEKSITGKVNISTKKDDKYISKSLPFIAFKSKIDRETEAEAEKDMERFIDRLLIN